MATIINDIKKIAERPLFSEKLFAAGSWRKYNSNPDMDLMGQPDIRPKLGERCLWSIEIFGKRNYFTGHLSSYNNQFYVVPWDGFSYAVNDTLYYARVNKLDTQLSREDYEKEYLGTFNER